MNDNITAKIEYGVTPTEVICRIQGREEVEGEGHPLRSDKEVQ